MENLTTTNLWLGILAIVSLLEFLMILAAGFMAFRLYKQVSEAVENIERMHIAPLRARVDALLDEVHEVTAKVKQAQSSVESAFQHMSGTGSMVADAVRSKAWPLIGLLKGIKVVASAVMKNGRDNGTVLSRYDTSQAPSERG
jgi:hypothetical protein